VKRAGKQHDRDNKSMQAINRTYHDGDHNFTLQEEIDGRKEKNKIDRRLDKATKIEVLDSNDAEDSRQTHGDGVAFLGWFFD